MSVRDASDGRRCASDPEPYTSVSFRDIRERGSGRLHLPCYRYVRLLIAAEEVEHAPGEQCGGIGIIGRQRAVGEVVLVAGVEEQLRVLGLLDELTGGVDIALAGEDRVGVHPVYLRWHPHGPGAERGDRDTGIEQQRPARSRPCLRQLLGREHAEREPGIYQVAWQPLYGPGPARDHLVGKADLPGISHPVLEGGEGPALEQVGRVHGVAGVAQLVGEGDDAGGQSLRMVEEHYLGHDYPSCRAAESPVDLLENKRPCSCSPFPLSAEPCRMATGRPATAGCGLRSSPPTRPCESATSGGCALGLESLPVGSGQRPVPNTESASYRLVQQRSTAVDLRPPARLAPPGSCG